MGGYKRMKSFITCIYLTKKDTKDTISYPVKKAIKEIIINQPLVLKTQSCEKFVSLCVLLFSA
jgi:hypothetical protein